MRALLCLSFLLGTRASHATEPEPSSTGAIEPFELPDVPVDQLTETPPQPSFDVGIVSAVCARGADKFWERTQFCLGGLVDVIALRKKETDPGAGGYLQLSSAGFRDLRVGLGGTGIVSLIDWFSLTARGGGLLVVSSDGVQPGLEGYLEFGQRSLSLSSHYALSHSFIMGMQYALAAGDLPASHAMWLGLRIDAIWLTAPVALFR